MGDSHRVLLAVDESSASRRALEYVAGMIDGKKDFHIGLLHVELPPRMLEWGGSEDPDVEEKVERRRDAEYRQMEKRRVAEGKTLLQQLQPILTAKGVNVEARLVKFDEPLDQQNVAKEILTTAKERGYGTVVVGRHAFSAWKRLFSRHVCEELLAADDHVTIWVVE